MTRLQAHERLAELYASDRETMRSWLPSGYEPAEYGPSFDSGVLLLTAAVSLSGGLCDADPSELEELAAHFRGLLSADVVTLEEWDAEAHEILDELISWGSRQTSLSGME